jgi:hypothetical protein
VQDTLIPCTANAHLVVLALGLHWGLGPDDPSHLLRKKIKLYTPLHANHQLVCTPLLWIGSHVSMISLLYFLLYVPTNLTSFDHPTSPLSSHYLLIVMFKCKMSCCKSTGSNLGRQIENVLCKKIKLFTPLHANHPLVCTPLLWIGSHVSRTSLFYFLLYVSINLTSFDHPKSHMSSHFLLIVIFKCKMSCCKSMGSNLGRQIENVLRKKIKLFTPFHANHTLGCTPLLCIGTHISKVICYISCFMYQRGVTSVWN